jgi:hypothetical protein
MGVVPIRILLVAVQSRGVLPMSSADGHRYLQQEAPDSGQRD